MLLTRKRKGPTARARAKKARQDRAVAAEVREIVEARDGYCRYGADVHPANRSPCQGFSEWAHFGDRKRFKTRGMPANWRHTTTHTFMGCTAHHDAYDAGRLIITADTERGCDGPLSYQERPR